MLFLLLLLLLLLWLFLLLLLLLLRVFLRCVGCNGDDVMKSPATNPKLGGRFWARGTAEFLINFVIMPKVVLAKY